MFEYLRTSQPVIMTKDIPTQTSNLPVYLFEIREANYYPFEDFAEKTSCGWGGGHMSKILLYGLHYKQPEMKIPDKSIDDKCPWLYI